MISWVSYKSPRFLVYKSLKALDPQIIQSPLWTNSKPLCQAVSAEDKLTQGAGRSPGKYDVVCVSLKLVQMAGTVARKDSSSEAIKTLCEKSARRADISSGCSSFIRPFKGSCWTTCFALTGKKRCSS